MPKKYILLFFTCFISLYYCLVSSGTSSTRIGNTVLVKLPNGQTKPMTKLSKRPFELVRIQKSMMGAPKNARSLVPLKKPPGNLTPSVSIAPVAKKVISSLSRPPSDTDSENEEEVMRRPLPKPKRMYYLYTAALMLLLWIYCSLIFLATLSISFVSV